MRGCEAADSEEKGRKLISTKLRKFHTRVVRLLFLLVQRHHERLPRAARRRVIGWLTRRLPHAYRHFAPDAGISLVPSRNLIFGYLDTFSKVYLGQGKHGLIIDGWILHPFRQIRAIQFTLEDPNGQAVSAEGQLGIARPDVAQVYPEEPQAPKSGYRAIFPADIGDGMAALVLRARVQLEGDRKVEVRFRAHERTPGVANLVNPAGRVETLGQSMLPGEFLIGDAFRPRRVYLGSGSYGYYLSGWIFHSAQPIHSVSGWVNGKALSFTYGQVFMEALWEYPDDQYSNHSGFNGIYENSSELEELQLTLQVTLVDGRRLVCEMPARNCEDFTGLLADLRPHPLGSDRKVTVYQIYFDEKTSSAMDAGFVPYFNSRPTRFLENSVIVDLVARQEHLRSEFFGVFSWQFFQKIPLTSDRLLTLMREDEFSSDVYTFFEPKKEQCAWLKGAEAHPGLIEGAERVLRKAGYPLDLRKIRAPAIYQNHFVCRSTIYDRYVREMLMPCMDVMADDEDQELRQLLMSDSRYHFKPANAANVAQIFDRPYYTLHPFICERLFSTWLALNPRKVRHLFCVRI